MELGASLIVELRTARCGRSQTRLEKLRGHDSDPYRLSSRYTTAKFIALEALCVLKHAYIKPGLPPRELGHSPSIVSKETPLPTVYIVCGRKVLLGSVKEIREEWHL